MNDMKRLLSYAGPYKRDMIFGAVLVLEIGRAHV